MVEDLRLMDVPSSLYIMRILIEKEKSERTTGEG
jgi:hypothetical protein